MKQINKLPTTNIKIICSKCGEEGLVIYGDTQTLTKWYFQCETCKNVHVINTLTLSLRVLKNMI